jgi:hypothetical protein
MSSGPLGFDDDRSLSAENPNMGVSRFLPQQWRDQSGETSDLHLYDIASGFATGSCKQK